MDAGDVRGAVPVLHNDGSIAEYDETTANALRAKHPIGPVVPASVTNDCDPIRPTI